MGTKLRVLSIDDNHQNLSLIQQALEERFDVISSAGEESIEELVHDCEPDIVLLDIMLNQSDGFEICKTIRAMGGVKKVVIIFVSSLHSLDDKIKAYQAGGNDYICKPVNIEELLFKLESYKNLLQEQQALTIQMEEASHVAFTSMQQSSELALIFEFFSNSQPLINFDDLYTAAQKILNNLNLSCAIEFRTKYNYKQYPQGKVSQLESEILDLGKAARRIVPFGKNVLFNAKGCSLLVKNLPIEEENRGRLQDLLAIFLDIIDSRIQAIEYEQGREKDQSTVVNQLRCGIDDNFSQVNISLFELEKNIEHVFEQMQKQVQQELQLLTVNERHQQHLAHIIQQAKSEINHAIESSVDIDFHHQRIETLLGQLK